MPEENDDVAAGGRAPVAGAPQHRADAIANRERILAAAVDVFATGDVTMVQVAAAAHVGRSTLYRHFPTRRALAAAVNELHTTQRAVASSSPAAPPRATPPPYQPPGRLGRVGPTALDVTHVLDAVPPHLIADQLVAEARRVAGATVALYVVDIDGSELVRLAGSDEFPERLRSPPALGPEIVAEGLPQFYERLRHELPRCEATPLWLRGRVLGLLLSVGTPSAELADVAAQGAAALELANDYTDAIESARRRMPTTAAAEIQHHLLPPRVVRVTGAEVAGGLLPTYEIGGDWFDFVENRDGVWLAIADASGNGPTAAGLSATALGALRAARRSGRDLVGAAQSMDEVVRMLGNPDFQVTALLATWHAPSATLTWIACGAPPAHVVAADGTLARLEGPTHPPLGARGGAPDFRPNDVRLARGERLLLASDGVTERRLRGGGRFGVDGLQRAVAAAPAATAAATAMAIQQAVLDGSGDPLEDDATVVVLAVD